VWALALWSRPCGKKHFRDLPTPDWASPSTTITYCSVYMTRSQVPAQSGVGKSRKCFFPHGVACTRPVQCHRPATNACMDLFPHCTGFHLLFFIPRSSFGRGNFRSTFQRLVFHLVFILPKSSFGSIHNNIRRITLISRFKKSR